MSEHSNPLDDSFLQDETLEEVPPEGELYAIPVRAKPSPARLTIVSVVYHQPLGEEPHSFPHKISRPLLTDEQAYTRKLKVTQEWQPIDIGWLTSLSLLLITNEEGKYATQPSEEEKLAISQKVLEIGFQGKVNYPPAYDLSSLFPTPVFLIGPGDSFSASPCDCESLYLRCQSGVAKVTINAFPK